MDCKVKLIIAREGNNIFVDGLPGKHTSIQILPSFTQKDRAIDSKGKVWLEVDFPPDSYEEPKEINVSLRSRNQLLQVIPLEVGKGKTIKFNPWDYV